MITALLTVDSDYGEKGVHSTSFYTFSSPYSGPAPKWVLYCPAYTMPAMRQPRSCQTSLLAMVTATATTNIDCLYLSVKSRNIFWAFSLLGHHTSKPSGSIAHCSPDLDYVLLADLLGLQKYNLEDFHVV